MNSFNNCKGVSDNPLGKSKNLVEANQCCRVTKKRLKLFCFDCKELLCIPCFLTSHREHEVSEVDSDANPDVLEALRDKTDEIHEYRISKLDDQIGQISMIMEKISDMKEVMDSYRNLAVDLKFIANYIEKKNINHISSWIDKNKERLLMIHDKITVIKHSESQKFLKFSEISENYTSSSANTKAFIYQYYINKTNDKKIDDSLFVIEDIPFKPEDIKNDFLDIIEELIGKGIDRLTNAMIILKQDPSPEYFREINGRLRKELECKIDKFEEFLNCVNIPSKDPMEENKNAQLEKKCLENAGSLKEKSENLSVSDGSMQCIEKPSTAYIFTSNASCEQNIFSKSLFALNFIQTKPPPQGSLYPGINFGYNTDLRPTEKLANPFTAVNSSFNNVRPNEKLTIQFPGGKSSSNTDLKPTEKVSNQFLSESSQSVIAKNIPTNKRVLPPYK